MLTTGNKVVNAIGVALQVIPLPFADLSGVTAGKTRNVDDPNQAVITQPPFANQCR